MIIFCPQAEISSILNLPETGVNIAPDSIATRGSPRVFEGKVQQDKKRVGNND